MKSIRTATNRKQYINDESIKMDYKARIDELIDEGIQVNYEPSSI